MPDITLSITIPEQYVARIQAATGITSRATGETYLKNKLKADVLAYEQRQARINEDIKVLAAREAQETAVSGVAEIPL